MKDAPRKGFNIITFIFIISLLKTYKIPDAIFDVVFASMLLVIIVFMIFPEFKYLDKNIKIKNSFLIFWVSSFVLLGVTAILADVIRYFIIVYVPFYLTALIVYLSWMKYGEKIIYQFGKHFVLLMSIFSLFNLYQVVFHRPILLNFLADKYYFFQLGAVGTAEFRTISVFGHPIIAGLFFVFAFAANLFFMKPSVIRTILQILLLINVYSTNSRSAWLCLAVMLLFILIQKTKTRKTQLKLKRKHLLSLYLSFCVGLVALFALIFNMNKILSIISERFGDSLTTNSTDISNIQRTGTVDLIFRNFRESDFVHQIFGNGLATAPQFMQDHTVAISGFRTTDNQLLTWLYEFGLFGILLISLTLISIFSSYLYNRKSALTNFSILVMIVLIFEMVFFEVISGYTNLTIIAAIAMITLSFKKKNKSIQT